MLELDEYYSLTGYASRFSSEPERLIDLYVSQKSTAAMIAVLERKHGTSFREDSIDILYRRAENDEVTPIRHFIAITGCQSITVENGEVMADIAVYNDFVAYLTASGINS